MDEVTLITGFVEEKVGKKTILRIFCLLAVGAMASRTPISEDIFPFISQFENRYPSEFYVKWATDNVYIPFLAVVLYICAIAVGKSCMRDRKPIQLKRQLFLWNSSLAIFSFLTFVRSLQFFQHEIPFRNHSLKSVICELDLDNVTSFWNFLFLLSKLLELGDTFFLVVRKRPILFLHWYHHSTVLIFGWICNIDRMPIGKFFVTMNVLVHSIMYTYYALAALGIRLPKVISMSITSLQILQMFGGIFFLTTSAYYSITDSGCMSPRRSLLLGFLIYGSYLALFVNFFVQAYLVRSRAEEKRRETENRKTV